MKILVLLVVNTMMPQFYAIKMKKGTMQTRNCTPFADVRPLFSRETREMCPQISIRGKAPTAHITHSSWCNTATAFALPLVKVRIMNNPVNTSPCAPAKGNLALGAPHLIASRNLIDWHPTCWTRFCILAQHGNGLEIIFIALMICKSRGWFDPFWDVSLDRVAFRTYVQLTQTASPMIRKKSATIIPWTLANKFSRLFRLFIMVVF